MAQDKRATVEQLQTTLSHEAAGYHQLVELARREYAALKTNNLSDLAATVQNKEALLGKLQQWEKSREQLVTRLVQDFKLPATATLSDLIERFDDAIATRLSALRDEFVDLMEELLMLNHTNHRIIQAGLVRVEATFDYLASQALPADGQYSHQGSAPRPSEAATGHILNWKA